MPLSFTADLHAELLTADGRLPLERRVTLPGECGEVLEVSLPDGTNNLTVCGTGVGQVTALVVTSDKAVQVCVGDVAQNQPLTLAPGGVLALLDIDVDAAHVCALSYTPGDGSEATCLVQVLGTAAAVVGFTGWIPAMTVTSASYGGVYWDLMVATQTRPDEALPTTAAIYRSSNSPTGAPWLPEFPATGGGQATAMTMTEGPGEYELLATAAMRFSTRPGASEIWRLGIPTIVPELLLVTLPDNTPVTSLYNLWPVLLIGTDAGQLYRWTDGGSLELVLTDPEGRSVRLFRLDHNYAVMESPLHGLRVWMSDRDDEGATGSWTNLGSGGLFGTRCSNVVALPNYGTGYDDAIMATSSEEGESVQIFRWVQGQGAQQMHIFNGRMWQRPGPLWVYRDSTIAHLYVGRMSQIAAPPLLELWKYSSVLQVWTHEADFSGWTQNGILDTNTSITAIAPVMARGKFFVATGTPFEPYGEPVPGARIYALPLPQGCRIV